MGCDGGTIPTRDELVKTKKKPEQKDKDSERLFQWQNCHLTQEPLRKPIVSCQLGKLYNKEAVIERLLSKSKDFPPNISHVKSLKDVRELDLTPNPSFNARNPSVGDNYVDRLVSPWICPITGLEMNGRFKFIFDWTSGKVLSERGHKMISADDSSKIVEENVVFLNPTEDEFDLMVAKMEARTARLKAEKKAKKDAKKQLVSTDIVKTSKRSTTEPEKASAKKMRSSSEPEASTTKSNDKATGLSLQKDPNKSEVFKSLFSSHPSAQNKEKGHWVTFDPRYN